LLKSPPDIKSSGFQAALLVLVLQLAVPAQQQQLGPAALLR
jgi:hypothetical protein